METETQAVMFADVHLWRPPEPEPEAQPAAGERKARFKLIERHQLLWRPVDVEQLVGPDHAVRAIWDLVSERDLGAFHERVQALEGVAGRPAYDPQLLISLWIYAYMDGTPSARQIERQCQYHPAYQWLTGATTVCAHTLSDFRTAHAEALKELTTQVLALLAQEGLVDLEQVTQDGTKVRASAGADTFRREATIQRHLEQARQRLEELEWQDGEELSARTLEARQRAAREKVRRMEQALQQMEQIQRSKPEAEKAQVRVSLTDPEARIMKQNDGGFAPSYNVQFTTDAKQTVIVSVEVTQQGSDAEQLQPAMERLQQEAGQAPRQALVDGGYTSRENIVRMAARSIDLIGPPLDGNKQKETLYQLRGVAPEFRPEAFAFDATANRYTCPAGYELPYKSKQVLVGQTKYTYVADGNDCAACAHKAGCCPTSSKTGRSIVRAEDGPEMAAFRAKMDTPEAKSTYKKRGQVAEFPNLCLKERFGVRQFSVRGLKKVNIEAHWVKLTFNVQQWIRLCWRPRLATAS
jgi:transposase